MGQMINISTNVQMSLLTGGEANLDKHISYSLTYTVQNQTRLDQSRRYSQHEDIGSLSATTSVEAYLQ